MLRDFRARLAAWYWTHADPLVAESRLEGYEEGVKEGRKFSDDSNNRYVMILHKELDGLKEENRQLKSDLRAQSLAYTMWRCQVANGFTPHRESA